MKHVVKEMRAAGRKVGICRVVAFRPFPAKEVAEALKGVKNIAVIDRVSAMGSFGPLYEEVLAAMNYGGIKANAYSFVAGLGGRDIWEQTVENVIDKAEELGAKQAPCEAPIWIDLKEEDPSGIWKPCCPPNVPGRNLPPRARRFWKKAGKRWSARCWQTS